MVYQKFIYCLVFAVGGSSMLNGKIIVWDLVGVLFEPNKLGMGAYIMREATGSNPLNLFKLAASVPSEQHIKKMMNVVLEKIKPSSKNCPCLPDDEGVCVSKIYCDYLTCNIPSAQLREKIHQSIRQLAEEGYFKNNVQQKIVSATLDMIFTPQLYAYYMRPNKKGIALLKLCAEKLNSTGKPLNQMMILSNWDCESFPLLQKQKASEKVFKYFKKENVFISGQFNSIDALKPSEWIFNYIIDYKKMRPSDFILIDNSPANVDAARAYGMQAILVKNGNYKQVEEQLRKLGAL